VAHTARTTKAQAGLSFILAAVLLGGSLFLAPANAAYARIHKAIEQLTQAERAVFGSDQQIKLLTAALNSLQSAYTKGAEKTKAMDLVTSAIADAKAKNAAKFKADMTGAIASANAVMASTSESTASEPATAPAAPAVPDHSAPPAKLTEDQARAVVLIKGDNAEGTGFLVKTANGPVVMTNIHVISNNPNLKITTNTGDEITILSYKGATDRDMVMIAIKDGSYSYLDLATDISNTVQPGDEVITPGNSEGGEVMLNTSGKVLGIGPDRIEFDNPIYHGNSGGPVFHVKSGKVIAIVTEAIKVDVSNELDKASFANRNSAILHSMRYFGFRVDNVPGWETYDWRRFQNETAFLDQFDQRSRCLDCYLNAPDDNKPEDTVWKDDDKIVKANSEYFDQAVGADTSQQMDATRVMWAEISDIAGIDMDAIQNLDNFYTFDRQRAKDEIAYRKALRAELDTISNNVSRMGSMPRTNK